MKKVLMFSILVIACAQSAYAYPNVDVTTGSMPFRVIQQQNFQKMEYNDFKKFKDADDYAVEQRFDEAKQLKQEYDVKNLKQPAKIMLGQPKEVPSVTEMELIQKDGKIQIKHTD